MATNKVTPDEGQSAPAPASRDSIRGHPPGSPQDKALALVNSKGVVGFMTILTIYALFGDDVRLAAFDKSSDDGFSIISLIALIAFAFELSCNCFGKPDYLNSFYFWLDFISTISLVPDIGFIWQPLTGTEEESGNSEDSSGQAAALKAGRASRAGTKAGRIVRIVRLVRMVRIVRLYKMHGAEEDAEKQDQTLEPSKVGKKLSELTTRRLIIMVLVLILVLPMFDGGLEETLEEFYDGGLSDIHRMSQQRWCHNSTGVDSAAIASGACSPTIDEAAFKYAFRDYVRNTGKLLYVEICQENSDDPLAGCARYGGKTWDWSSDDGPRSWLSNTGDQPLLFQKWNDDTDLWDVDSPFDKEKNGKNGWEFEDLRETNDVLDDFRQEELQISTDLTCYSVDDATGRTAEAAEDDCASLAYYDIKSSSQGSAVLNVLKTIFIMFVLGGGCVFFQKDAQLLVIGPIERMMDLVQKLATNPLASAETGKLEDDEEAMQGQGYETALLESTLTKIGALLQVGFGAAGAEIIGKNMGSGEMNAMVPGKKITSVYGFCDIRQFTDTTECLQEEVMVYVNKLGDIVHSATHAYYGMANKNVGDAFLLSWKICDGLLKGYNQFEDDPNDDIRLKANLETRAPPNAGAGRRVRTITPTEMADSAFTAFLKCIVDLDNANTAGSLTEYASHPRVLARFGPNFRIRMGFGMHVGWAVEGAIGSTYKIDATYLSQHVEMTDRLEAGSKIFGTPLNMSHWLYQLISPAARRFMRPIDRIQVAGCPVPMTVYTFDVMNMKKGFGEPKFDASGEQLPVDFENNPEYSELQIGLHPSFKSTFEAGIEKYFSGDWPAAKAGLEAALKLKPKDGPTLQLLNYMAETNNVAPAGWNGVHPLDGY